jgi:isopentenyl phosphate kinase
VIYLKLGGSLITDKHRAETVRADVLARLAGEVAAARDARPGLRLLLGHGSGSFGHIEASKHGTRSGVATPEAWRGFAAVSAAAARLNRIVADALLDAGVPILSLQPSASARCHDGRLMHLDTGPIEAALAYGLVPLLYGDVAFDEVRGGTIASTEELFAYLLPRLGGTHILLLGEAGGVYASSSADVIPEITPRNYDELRATLRTSDAVDVTGGMASKVAEMLALAQAHPSLSIRIFSGRHPGLLTRALVDLSLNVGTTIHS